MTHFHTLLSLNNDLLKTDDDDEPGLMEELRSQICDNIGKSTLPANLVSFFEHFFYFDKFLSLLTLLFPFKYLIIATCQSFVNVSKCIDGST